MPKTLKTHGLKPQLMAHCWPASRWKRAAHLFLALIILWVFVIFSTAQWYIQTEKSKPLEYGVSFIPDYASSLGVDPQATMDGLIKIGVKHFRLVSYWSDTEPTKGQYDFSQLDWQFKKAEAAHVHVTLVLGLRQPRWPECHIPAWATNEPQNIWQPQLESQMKAIIARYHNSASLADYQLENEYFLKGFGTCTNYDRSRLVNEYGLIKAADSIHPVVVGRSNNDLGTPLGQPTPDEFSVSVYKRVWDASVTGRYLEYPFPAWYYGYLAGVQKIINHRDMRIAELQAEAWPPNGHTITEISLNEQDKSLDAHRLKDRFSYGKATGMRQIDLWGAEYWYYRLTVLHDPSLWNVAQQEFQASN